MIKSKEYSQQWVAGYAPQVARPQNPDVGATMNNRTNKSDDPVVGDTATSRPASSLLENRWNSQKTEMNSPNKALHHYGAQSAPRVNADVRLKR